MLLVISGGGLRAFYAIGVLKGLEELSIDKEIEAIFGVSGGAIVGAYRSAGYNADSIYDNFINLDFKKAYQINWFGSSLLKTDQIQNFFKKDLPDKFEDLSKKLFIGAVDGLVGKFLIFDSGDLIQPLLGSMSLPGIFQPVNYSGKTLMDGGLINNFPVEIAKDKYPDHKIIGIALNKISNLEHIDGVFQSITRSFEIVVESSTLQQLHKVDYLFYPDLEIQILDLRKNLAKKAFISGYNDCLIKFKD